MNPIIVFITYSVLLTGLQPLTRYRFQVETMSHPAEKHFKIKAKGFRPRTMASIVVTTKTGELSLINQDIVSA